MRVTVDDNCTGCGLCVDTCPEVFDLDDDVAKVLENPVPEEHADACRDAVEGCPAEAITLEE
ncbi:MAG: ferredoxin [Planctomycetota bacterium]